MVCSKSKTWGEKKNLGEIFSYYKRKAIYRTVCRDNLYFYDYQHVLKTNKLEGLRVLSISQRDCGWLSFNFFSYKISCNILRYLLFRKVIYFLSSLLLPYSTLWFLHKNRDLVSQILNAKLLRVSLVSLGHRSFRCTPKRISRNAIF